MPLSGPSFPGLTRQLLLAKIPVMSGFLRYQLILVMFAAPALGSVVVNIDIQPSGSETMTGGDSTVLPSAGPFWNTNAPNSQSLPLLSSDGAETGLSLTADLYDPPFSGDGDALYRDYMIGEVRITGLVPEKHYDVVFYGGANQMTLFRVDQPFTRLSPDPGYCPYESKELPGTDGCDYVRGIVTSDPAGEFALDVNLGALAGLQLALPGHNPEPSTLLLLPASALAALRRRRYC